ncbi:uncharacterized protein LOC135074497 [Ostrinia nubilalis]|uniref:uncharacterized protein LOC135074497 n=1 Tax=Ostrinia nubilalis TaxID=29057 RepID=UPI00308223D2
MPRWGDEKTIKFIRLYKDHECLWNSGNPALYKNKQARDNAYMQIIDEMNEFDMTIQDVKNKIKGLRSTYHQELNKIKNSKSSGAVESDVYKPSLKWFGEIDFLKDTFQKTICFEIQQASPQTSIETLKRERPSSESSEALEQPQKSPRISEALEPQSHSSQKHSNKRYRMVARKRIQNRTKCAEPHNEIINSLQRLEKNITTVDYKDEFYYFGQSVAAQLRSLPLSNAMEMESKIQMLLSTERCQLLQNDLS